MKGYKLLYDYFLNWKLTALQCCGILYHIVENQSSVQFSSKTQSIKSVKPVTLLILCCPLFLSYSIFPSIRVFTNKSVLCIRWPKYWSFSFSISPSNEYSGLISIRTDWFDLLANPRDSQESSPTPQFKSISSYVQPSLWSNSHIHK